MLTLRPGDVIKVAMLAGAVVVVVQVVELDVLVAEDGADVDALSFAELEDDWKNRFLGACVIESCLPISIIWAHALFCSAEYRLPCVSSICLYISSTLAIFAVCLSYCEEPGLLDALAMGDFDLDRLDPLLPCLSFEDSRL